MNTRDIIAPPARATTQGNKIAAEMDFTDRYAERIDRTLCVYDFRARSSACKSANIRAKEANVSRERYSEHRPTEA
jgi:hypothetical protein